MIWLSHFGIVLGPGISYPALRPTSPAPLHWLTQMCSTGRSQYWPPNPSCIAQLAAIQLQWWLGPPSEKVLKRKARLADTRQQNFVPAPCIPNPAYQKTGTGRVGSLLVAPPIWAQDLVKVGVPKVARATRPVLRERMSVHVNCTLRPSPILKRLRATH